MLQNYTNLSTQKYDKNVFLSLKQKRVRHVKIISAKNLKIPSNIKKFQIWYTLHDSSNKIFYMSEKKENDLNPKWSTINHSKILNEYLKDKEFIICMWFSNLDNSTDSDTNSNINLLIQETIFLDGLYQLSDDYLNDTLKTADNLIVFDMFNHHFCELVTQRQHQQNKMELIALSNSLKLQQVNKIKFKQSYQIALLMRLNEVEKVIYNTVKNINRLKASIRTKFCQTSKLNELKSKKDIYLQHIQILKMECERKRMNIVCLNETKLNLIDKNTLIKKSILQKQTTIENKKKKINEIQTRNEELLAELKSLKEDLIIKQKKLIKSLSKIYPIENVIKSNSNGEINIDQHLKIANVFLPNSKFYVNNDEQQISVGLGYVCHCLLILCSILNIPLRHPIIYRASKSTIVNFIQDKSILGIIGGSNSISNSNSNNHSISASSLSVNESMYLQELALYRTNAVQETSFSYAVFLLNKNLAQLRILFDSYKNFDFNNTLGSLFWLLNQT